MAGRVRKVTLRPPASTGTRRVLSECRRLGVDELTTADRVEQRVCRGRAWPMIVDDGGLRFNEPPQGRSRTRLFLFLAACLIVDLAIELGRDQIDLLVESSTARRPHCRGSWAL